MLLAHFYFIVLNSEVFILGLLFEFFLLIIMNMGHTNVIVIDEFSLLEMRPFLTIDKILRGMAKTISMTNITIR